MNILSQIIGAMQVILTETTDMIARQTEFVKKQRKFNGHDLEGYCGCDIISA
jgi:hypothetical protein